LEEPAVPTGGPTGILPRVARQSSRVLVVDDNKDTAAGLLRLLKLLGHDVRVAHDGPTAIELARTHRPEIILLDIGLPGMDGYQVAKQLRREECCNNSLIIAASGYGQEEDRRRSREAGFDHHLVKPVDFDALMTLFAARPN
jgi:CheY-like chemotaxis protein